MIDAPRESDSQPTGAFRADPAPLPPAPSANSDADTPATESTQPDWAALQRSAANIERLLTDVRAALELLSRDRRHRDFSLTRFVGAVAQAGVLALLAWAVADVFLASTVTATVLKLGFAAVLQAGALTALLLSRPGGTD